MTMPRQQSCPKQHLHICNYTPLLSPVHHLTSLNQLAHCKCMQLKLCMHTERDKTDVHIHDHIHKYTHINHQKKSSCCMCAGFWIDRLSCITKGMSPLSLAKGSSTSPYTERGGKEEEGEGVCASNEDN